jgi:hypothetical protein
LEIREEKERKVIVEKVRNQRREIVFVCCELERNREK